MSSESNQDGEFECQVCAGVFDNKRGLETHRGIKHDPLPKEKAREMYVKQGLTSKQIAYRTAISHRVVKRRLGEYDLWGKRPTNFTLEPGSGYPTVTRTGDGDSKRLRVHRLVVIASGEDPHKVFSGDYDVDHINGCSLDNRPNNLRLMKKAAHGSKDGKKRMWLHAQRLSQGTHTRSARVGGQSKVKFNIGLYCHRSNVNPQTQPLNTRSEIALLDVSDCRPDIALSAVRV